MLPLGLGVAVKNVGQHEMSVRQRGTEQGRHPGDLDVARAERLVHGALSPEPEDSSHRPEEEERLMEPGLRFGVRPAPYRFPEPLGERPQAVLIVPQVRYRDFDLGIREARNAPPAKKPPAPSPARAPRRAPARRQGTGPRLSRAFGVIRARFLIQ